MPKLSLVKGTTSFRTAIFIQDTSKAAGEGLTGLLWNSANLTCYKYREDDTGTAGTGGDVVPLVSAVSGTYISGGFIEKNSSGLPGIYEFGIQDADLAVGSDWVVYHFHGAANMAPVTLEIELTGFDMHAAKPLTLGMMDDDFQQRIGVLAHSGLGQRIYVRTSGDGGSDSNGGTSPSDAKLTLAGGSGAISVAAAGDVIEIGPGTFAEGTTQIVLPDDVSLTGAGSGLTIIQSDVLFTAGTMFQPGFNSVVQGVRITGKHTISDDGTDWTGLASGDNQMCFGTSVDGDFKNVLCIDCIFEGSIDGIFLSHATTELSVTFIRCRSYSGFDALAMHNKCRVHAFDCVFSSNAAWGNEASQVGDTVRAVGTLNQDNVQCLLANCELRAVGGAVTNKGLHISLDTGVSQIWMTGGSIFTSGTGALDIDQDDSSCIITVSGVRYDPDKVSAVLGPFLVAQQSLDYEASLPGTATADTQGDALQAVYHADIRLTVDTSNDEWTITWFKNGAQISSGIGSTDIQVIKRVDGTDLVASTAMTEIGSTGSFKYDEPTNRLTAGESAIAVVGAVIDNATRSFSAVITRDV